MSQCYAQNCDISCSNRNKCGRKCRNVNIYEAPEKDVPRSGQQLGSLPPDPPEDGNWELQYCQWSGWTWVKKLDKDGKPLSSQSNVTSQEQPRTQQQQQQRSEGGRKNSQKADPKKGNKGGGIFSCFKKKEAKPTTVATSSQVSRASLTPAPAQAPKQPRYFDESGAGGADFDCFCCSCSNQMCCPCLLPAPCCCCCCCAEHPSEERDKRKSSKTMETQTCCEMKEQATKMSEMHVPKARRRCVCKPVCCPCVRRCPCLQPVCCPCKPGGQSNSSTSWEGDSRPNKKINTDIVNYCLTRNWKPSKAEFLNLKSSSFSTLHKSLDLFLKNNINIMNLFDKKKELHESEPVSYLGSNHTICSLTSDNILKSSDQEHCKLLTAVCDALLSSHKFDNDKLSSSIQPVKLPSAKSSDGKFDARDSQNSFGLIERILSDSNFPTLTKSSKKPGTYLSRKSSTKLTRNRSRTIAAPRFPNRTEALRKYIDLMRVGHNHRISKNSKKPEENFKLGELDNKPIVTEVFKNGGLQQRPSLKLETIDDLLTSINFASGSSTKTNAEEPNMPSSNDTSPLFTDLDLILTLDEGKRDDKDR